MIGPVLVTRRTSIGQRAKQYWLLLATSTGPVIDQYWSHHPLLRVRCEAYVYEGIVRGTLRRAFGRRDDGVSLKGRVKGVGYFFSPLMREGFCLTKSAQFFVAPAEAERRGEEVRKWWQRAAARPSVASSSRGI